MGAVVGGAPTSVPVSHGAAQAVALRTSHTIAGSTGSSGADTDAGLIAFRQPEIDCVKCILEPLAATLLGRPIEPPSVIVEEHH